METDNAIIISLYGAMAARPAVNRKVVGSNPTRDVKFVEFS